MFSILEMMIVLIGSALLTMQGIKEDIATKHTNLLQIEGQNQASINAALGSYITAQYGNLMAVLGPNFSQTTSTPLAAPTLAQLAAASNNRVTFWNGPFWGGAYQISLTVVPSVCSIAAGTCHIASQLYANRPLLKGGTPDIAGAGILAAAGGAQFGYSTNRTPATITGLSGQWTTANPLASQAGTILAINGFGADGNSPYYRRDGALPLTGTMNANNQDMQNIGNMSGKTLALQGGNSLNIGGGAIYYGDGRNAAVRTDGGLFIQNAAGTAAAPIAQVGSVNVQGTVTASGNVSAPTATLTADGGALTIGPAGVNYYGDHNGSAAIRANNGLYIQGLDGATSMPIQQVGSINSSGTITAPFMNLNAGAGNCSWNAFTIRGGNQAFICNPRGNWVPLSNLVGNLTTEQMYRSVVNGSRIPAPTCGPGGSPWWKIIPQTIATDYAQHNPPIGGALYSMGGDANGWFVVIYNILDDGNNGLMQDVLGMQAEVDTGCSFGNNPQ
jgi:hypothetical protein